MSLESGSYENISFAIANIAGKSNEDRYYANLNQLEINSLMPKTSISSRYHIDNLSSFGVYDGHNGVILSFNSFFLIVFD